MKGMDARSAAVAASIVAAAVFAASAPAAATVRCGWFDIDNGSGDPPQRADLKDREAIWQFTRQAGTWPVFSPGQLYRNSPAVTDTGPPHLGCACMNVEVSATGQQIVRISRARALPLVACFKDPDLFWKPDW